MIEVQHVRKRFGENAVLRDVSFQIEAGEIFALVGRSGSGKSVLLKHLVGLLRPDGGRVSVCGRDLTRLSRAELQGVRRRFGMLFQSGALFDSMTAFENIVFPLRLLDDEPDDEEMRRRAGECLALVEMEGAAHQLPAELSGGQKKRVALARALARSPQVLFCDEPNSGLDPETSEEVDDLIQRLARRLDMTAVIVTHDMHSVLTVADRVGFLHEGRMQFVGTVEAMRACPDPELCRFMEAGAYQV